MDFEIPINEQDPERIISHIMDRTGRPWKDVAPGVFMAMQPLPDSAIEGIMQDTGKSREDVIQSLGPSILRVLTYEEEASMNRFTSNATLYRRHAEDN